MERVRRDGVRESRLALNPRSGGRGGGGQSLHAKRDLSPHKGASEGDARLQERQAKWRRERGGEAVVETRTKTKAKAKAKARKGQLWSGPRRVITIISGSAGR